MLRFCRRLHWPRWSRRHHWPAPVPCAAFLILERSAASEVRSPDCSWSPSTDGYPASDYGEAARSRAARPFYCSAVSFLIPACHGSALASENVGRDSLLWRDRLAGGFDVRCGRHGICSLTSPAVLSAETGSGQAHLTTLPHSCQYPCRTHVSRRGGAYSKGAASCSGMVGR